MIKVVYQRSEDGVGELCVLQRVVMEKEGICYHCDQPVFVGQVAMVLRVPDGEEYLLHRECAIEGSPARYAKRIGEVLDDYSK